MRSKIQLLIIATLLLFVGEALAQQGFGTNQPDKSSAVDIVSSKRGLLIPRVELTATTSSAPIVQTPAESLLVYNTATAGDVTPGYYYWQDNKWVRFVSSSTEKTVTVSEGENITVTPSTPDANTTDYTVSVKGGGTEGFVLVTKADGTGTEWVDPAEFIDGVVTADNGLTMDTNHNITLGGALNKETIINTDPTNTLAITGLEDVSTGFNSVDKNVVIMGSDGVLQITSPKAMVEDAIEKGLDAKTLSGDAMINVADGDNAVLKDVSLSLYDKSITADKLTGGTGDPDRVGVANADGDITYKTIEDIITTNETVTLLVTNADGTFTYYNENEIGTNGEPLTTATGTTIDPNLVKIVDSRAVDGTYIFQNAAGTTIATIDVNANAIKFNNSTNDFTATDVQSAIEELATTINDNKGELTVEGGIEFYDATNGADKLLGNASIRIADGGIVNSKLANGAVTADKMKAAGDGSEEGMVPVADAVGNITYQNVATAIGQDLTTDGIIVIGTGETNSLEDAVLVPTALKIKEESITTTQIQNNTILPEDMNSQGNDKVLVTKNDGTVAWESQSSIIKKDKYTGTAPITVVADTNLNAEGGTDYTIGVNNANGTTAGVAKEADTNPTINFVDGIATVNIDNLATSQGKALTSNSITVSANGAGALLAETEIEITPGENAGEVLVTKVDGADITTEWIPASDLGNTVTADNGLTKTDNNIQLGGELNKPTAITTDETNTLAIEGLQNSTAGSTSIVLADEGTGVLRNVARSLEYTANANFNVATQGDYNKFVQEITIMATIGNSDLNITLPDAANAKGQVINVKIANTTEPDHYVNIQNVDGVTIYGSMPYQGWIIKSNGTSWSVVGRM